MARMSAISAPSWLEGSLDWAWPGLKPAAVEALPAAWVPALPARIEAPALRLPRPRRRTPPRPLRLARLLGLLAVAAGTFVLSGDLLRSAPAAPATLAL